MIRETETYLVRLEWQRTLSYWTSCCNCVRKSIISKSPMAKTANYITGTALFFAGIMAGKLGSRRARQEEQGAADKEKDNTNSTSDPVNSSISTKEWISAVQSLERRFAAQETAVEARFQQMETRLEEHSAKLAQVPSTAQIVSAMEKLLSKTMGSLDDRLTTQAHSIEILKTTVSETDSLLERVLESLDSLQAESSEGAEDGLFSRAV